MAVYTLSWTGLMIIGILNGVLRVGTYGRFMPELRAHQLSCFTGILFFGLAVYFLHKIRSPESNSQALLIGAIWLVLTILFEFGFGHYIMHHPWEKLFQDYRIDLGRLWSLVLLWIFLAPLVMKLVNG